MTTNPAYTLDPPTLQATTSLTQVIDKEMEGKTINSSVINKQEMSGNNGMCKCEGGKNGASGPDSQASLKHNRYLGFCF